MYERKSRITSFSFFFFFPTSPTRSKDFPFLKRTALLKKIYKPRAPVIFLCLFCLYFLHTFWIPLLLCFYLYYSPISIVSKFYLIFQVQLRCYFLHVLWTCPFEVGCLFLSPQPFIYSPLTTLISFTLVLYYFYNF